MEKSELIVELGVEEIPASMIADATRQFAELLKGSLKEQRLFAGACTQWHTPRRIIVGIEDIPSRQEDVLETVTGPPRKVAYDADGRPTRAALAFAEKNGVALGKIRIVQAPKGEYLSIDRIIKGEKTHRILERLIPGAIAGIQFPKTMHWSDDRFRFARPLRWIVALFNGKVVRFRVADISSSKFSAGHRFLGKSRLTVSSLESLRAALAENAVVADPEERESCIKAGLLKEAAACGGLLLEDDDLLHTVVNLNEAPSVIRGNFEERFLSLPKEILITVMREHQKYFSVMNEAGELLPAFLTVVNLKSDPDGVIRAGHERVLRARLADAAFFWETDRKNSLADRAALLKNVLFQEKLGSYHDKSERLRKLLPQMTEALGRSYLLEDLESATHIFKCDLVTDMVKEFTDLQGIVGGLYAKAEGYPTAVWRAVYEHYYPKSTGSPSPSSETGALLSLADRLDTVCGCFSIGLIPSGSGDPFAVRRQGNGILKIIFDHKLSLSLEKTIQACLKTYHREDDCAVLEELKRFFEGRMKFILEESGFAYDCIQAVLASGSDDPLDALERLCALQELRHENDFHSLASSFKRVANILSQSGTTGSEVDEAQLS
ncbi:MAG TPA: glycine--tRNA ligase subunit beta, partial [Acidobacteriota bacterium]|nr:glycine--tRNA ligase subunit beta [Acidobacteriota bacterium]